MKTFMCKAMLGKDKAPDVGMDWAISKRCLFSMGEEYLVAGGHKIMFSEIEKATLLVVPSTFFLQGCILSIKTKDGILNRYQLRYSSFWKKGLPFEVERMNVSMPSVWFSRIMIAGMVLFIVWYFFKKTW
ncbi:MAG: hypothetical protein JW932_15280 [Deltaproteobacteria bacterium]|nr:hypothetical protein [Deltaproteobacteria bacterium]